MAYDIQALRETARVNPGSLTADQKNALLEDRLGIVQSPDALALRGTAQAASRELYNNRAAGGITEAAPGWDYDPDANLAGVSGTPYTRRLTSAANRKDLTPMEQERMLRISAWLWDRNPLAARVLLRAVNYVMAEGVKVVARHEDEAVRDEIQRAIDAFWNDSRNDMDYRLLRWCVDWRAYGELILKATVNEESGLVRLAFVSPELVKEVKTEKGDIEIVTEVRIREKDGDSEGTPYKAVRVIEEPLREVGTPGRLKGEVLFFAANVLSDMVRGRSDMLRVADLFDAYDQFIWNRLERQAMLMAFVWSVELAGATPEQVEEWVKKNGGTPRPGSMQVHSDRVKWTPLTPSLGAADAAQESDLMLSVLATSEGMPAMWFGKEADPNRANGENLTGPTLKDMTGLQKEFRRVISTIVRFALDQCIIAGSFKLPKDLDTSKAFDIQFPELSAKDMGKAVANMSAAATGLTFGRQNELIDLESAQEAFWLTLAEMGLEIDPERVRKNIEAEKAEREQKALMDPYNQQMMAAQANADTGLAPDGSMPQEAAPDGSERRKNVKESRRVRSGMRRVK